MTIKSLLNKAKWYVVSFVIGLGAAYALLMNRNHLPAKPTHRKWEEIEPEEVPEGTDQKIAELRKRGLVK